MHFQMHFNLHQYNYLNQNSISFSFSFLFLSLSLFPTISAVGKLRQSCDRRDRAKIRKSSGIIGRRKEQRNIKWSGEGKKRVVVGGVKITRKRRNASHGKTGAQKRRRWPGIFALSSRARVLITGTRGVIFSPSPILASPLPPSFSGLVLAAFPPSPLSFSPRCSHCQNATDGAHPPWNQEKGG